MEKIEIKYEHIQKNYKEIYEMKGEDAEMKCEN